MAANATSVSVSHFSYASFIRGFHDYKDLWTPEPGEVLEVEAEPSNPYDPMATAVKKNGQVVGHVPRSFARYTHFFLLRQGNQQPCESLFWSRAGSSMFLSFRWTPELYKKAARVTEGVKETL